MALSVWRDGAPVVASAYGQANAETGTPMSPEMIGAVASLSKFVTAVAALALVDEGLLDLDRPIRQYLPWVDPSLGTRTTGDLLSNNGGLGEQTPRVPVGIDGSLRAVCEAMTEEAVVAGPRQVWGYSNTGFTLAGCVMEVVAEAPFPQVIQSTVFDPVGMRHSTYSRRWAMTHSHALGHDPREDPPRVVRPFYSNARIGPAGELMSTVGDLNRLAQALMNDGQLDGKRVLPQGLLERLTHPQGSGGPLLNGDRSYGLGLFVREHRGEVIIEHEGIYPGFGASIGMVPSRRLSAAAIANGRYSSPARSVQGALELTLGLEPSRTEPSLSELTAEEFQGAQGTYRGTGSTIELALVGGRPSLIRDSTSYPLWAHPDGHWEVPSDPSLSPIGTNWIEVVREDQTGQVSFIRIAWRLYRRVE
jgi:CubicO group peptidase (beta-lactamase class C family)